MNHEGFFLSPDGILIPVDSKHIAMVIDCPEKFGMTRDQVEEFYRRHGEPLGLEGAAREEILRILLRNGWTRIRNNRGLWSVETQSMTEILLFRLRAFAAMARKGGKPFYGKASGSDEVQLAILGTGLKQHLTFSELTIKTGDRCSPLNDQTTGEMMRLTVSAIDDYIPVKDLIRDKKMTSRG